MCWYDADRGGLLTFPLAFRGEQGEGKEGRLRPRGGGVVATDANRQITAQTCIFQPELFDRAEANHRGLTKTSAPVDAQTLAFFVVC